MLKEEKIGMPDSFNANIFFPLSVDGTHCTLFEPMHELYPMDRGYFSHKDHRAAYNYQIALSTTEQRIYAVHGPYPAGSNNDKIMFQKSGVQQILVAQNKRAIADGGYEGVDGVAIPNRRYHSKQTNLYMRRIRARHETVNGRIKNFSILSNTFRYKKERQFKHKMVFEAVCVIVATQIATKNPLFNA